MALGAAPDPSAMGVLLPLFFLVLPRARAHPLWPSIVPPARSHWGITRLSYGARQGFFGVTQYTYVQYRKATNDVDDLERLQRLP
jgi:hypothetical protein